MSRNLNLITKGRCSICKNSDRDRCRYGLFQTPTRVTDEAKPELNNREFTLKVYEEWARTQWPDDAYQMDVVEVHLKHLRKYLEQHPYARFYGF